MKGVIYTNGNNRSKTKDNHHMSETLTPNNNRSVEEIQKDVEAWQAELLAPDTTHKDGEEIVDIIGDLSNEQIEAAHRQYEVSNAAGHIAVSELTTEPAGHLPFDQATRKAKIEAQLRRDLVDGQSDHWISGGNS